MKMRNGSPKAWIKMAAMACLVGIFGGCGSDSVPDLKQTYQVEGRIILADGRPLSGGRIAFLSTDGLNPAASGEIRNDGRFSLTTREPNDGAAPGDYKVRIERAARSASFPIKYLDEDDSGLIVTIRPAVNELAAIRLR